MSVEYDEYLNEHINNVGLAYDWLRVNLPEIARYSNLGFGISLMKHDESKYSHDEYWAYDNYFYGNRTEGVKSNFNYAWLHHIHSNPHHWQYWVLINDDPKEGTVALDIPYKYVIEMICDWWSFSFKSGDLYEIFSWYDSHKEHMILSNDTRSLVEDILAEIRAKLDEQKIVNI